MGKSKPNSMSANFTNLPNKPIRYYKSTREDMVRYIPQGTKTTLEFGCGFGEFSALLKERFNTESWAIEIDKTAAREAAKKLDVIINADALESLSKIPANYFDCIILFDILEHLIDPYSLLCALKSKLTSKGVIVVSIPNIRYYRTFIDFVIHGNWKYEDQGILDNTHLRFFTYKSINQMFHELGFEIRLLEGIHPTSSRTFRLLNMLFLGAFSDVRYMHFAGVVVPEHMSD